MTSIGRELPPVFDRVLGDIRAVAENARELAAGDRGTVNVAAVPSVCSGLLPAAIARPRETHPGIVVRPHDTEGGVEATPDFEVTYMSTAIGLVRAGLGVAILPAAALELQLAPGLDSRTIRDASMQRRIVVATRKGRSLAPAVLIFRRPWKKRSVRAPRDDLVDDPHHLGGEQRHHFPSAKVLLHLRDA